MPRRRLTVYTIMFIAGISAGYFLFERSRPLETVGFIAAVLFAAFCLDFRNAPEHANRDMPGSSSVRRREGAVMAVFLLSGFLVFRMQYSLYCSQISGYTDSGSTDPSDRTHISGKVLSASLKDDRLTLVIRTDCSRSFKPKVLVTLYDYSSHPIYAAYETDNDLPDGERDSENPNSPEASDIYRLIGATVSGSGEYRELLPADNPGCFDYRMYMRGKGVCLSFKVNMFEVTEEGSGALHDTRQWLFRAREAFIACFDEETAGFIRGVVFGDKSGIDEDTVKEFNTNATGHILAVSGLHVGFLYGLLRFLTGRRRTKGVSLLIIAVILMYGEMTLWSAATIRACIVMSISLMAMHLRRPFDMLTSVSTAAFIILLNQPYQLFDTGFRMTFLAMCGIAFFTKPLSLKFGETLGAIFSVQLGIMPVTAYSFYRVNLISLFINIPIIMLASVLVPACIIMLMILLVFGSVPTPGIGLIELISYAVIRVNHMLNFDGAFSFMAAGIGAAMLSGYYITAFGFSSEWTRIKLIRRDYRGIIKAAAILMLPVIMLSACLYDSFSDDEIVFVAVGQGDCTHVRVKDNFLSVNSLLTVGKNYNVLIDGGGRDKYNTGERILMPYLLHGDAAALDIALVTHLHMDHFKGICELSEIYPVGALGVPADYRADTAVLEMYSAADTEEAADTETAESGTDINTGGSRDDIMILDIRPDTKINLGRDIYIDTLWPVEVSDEAVAIDDPNEYNTVYMIHYKGIRIMITGDLLEEDELKMLSYYKEKDRGKEESSLKCDILKVAHHGSKSSSSEAFLDAASPSVAVIQCGRNNIYGHPHEQTLQRLEERGIKVYRTDINGAVGIEIRKGKIAVDLYH